MFPEPPWSELKDASHGVTSPNLKLLESLERRDSVNKLVTHFILLEIVISCSEIASPLDESELYLSREKGDLDESIWLS